MGKWVRTWEALQAILYSFFRSIFNAYLVEWDHKLGMVASPIPEFVLKKLIPDFYTNRDTIQNHFMQLNSQESKVNYLLTDKNWLVEWSSQNSIRIHWKSFDSRQKRCKKSLFLQLFSQFSTFYYGALKEILVSLLSGLFFTCGKTRLYGKPFSLFQQLILRNDISKETEEALRSGDISTAVRNMPKLNSLISEVIRFRGVSVIFRQALESGSIEVNDTNYRFRKGKSRNDFF